MVEEHITKENLGNDGKISNFEDNYIRKTRYINDWIDEKLDSTIKAYSNYLNRKIDEETDIDRKREIYEELEKLKEYSQEENIKTR